MSNNLRMIGEEMKKKFIVMMLSFALLLSGCYIFEERNEIIGVDTKYETNIETDKESIDTTDEETIKEEESKQEIIETETEEEVIHEARLKLLGDVFPHKTEIRYAKAMAGGNGYDFNYGFELIKDFMSDADLTVLNNEFTSNPNWEISAYPTFNIPPAIFEALKNAGVDAVSTANNHCMDTRFEGIDSTIDYLDQYGIKHTGTQKDSSEPYLIMDVNGIKVGMLSYAEQLNGFESIVKTEEQKAKINMLVPEEIKKDIENIRSEGAEFVFVYPHWGNEYESYPRQDQIKLARNMIEWGADLVIGNHPHVVQPKEKYVTSDGRIGHIYYALGNVFSNQNYNSLGDWRTEQGLAVEVKIRKSSRDNKVEFVELIDHPIWTMNRPDEYGKRTRVYLISDFINGGPKSDEALSEELERMEKANRMTLDVLSKTVE